MPIYEYECRECKERFSVLQGMSEDGEQVSCPKCGAKSPKRLLSMFGSHGGASSLGASCSPGAFT
ncbi:MAG: zinc ribbon domain-containing protein [Candidatus Coatesbacteria bacterium]|nr:MAG: zinc ribbon domain-containing protein [Candidatus Coatesbacteria bacterium]